MMRIIRHNTTAALVITLGLAACGDSTGPATSLRDFVALDAGSQHACALTSDGEAYCWGAGDRGQLGYGAPASDRWTPTLVDSNERFTTVAAGDGHTCALAEDGSAWCWGWNPYYQRGSLDPWDVTPVAVTTDLRFTDIDAGWQHTCAIAEDATVHCWGSGRFGELGGGTSVLRSLIGQVGAIEARQIATGARHSCAILLDDTMVCWGDNSMGQLGIGSDEPNVAVPTPVAGGRQWREVAAGVTHTCAIAMDGFPWCWGSNAYGEAGDGLTYLSTAPGYFAPSPVNIRIGMNYIRAGLHVTCGVATDNIGYCWGRGAEMQLGNASPQDHSMPQPIYLQPGRHFTSDRFRWADLAPSSGTFGCGIADSNVFCWGTGGRGELGAATSTYSGLPQRVRG